MKRDLRGRDARTPTSSGGPTKRKIFKAKTIVVAQTGAPLSVPAHEGKPFRVHKHPVKHVSLQVARYCIQVTHLQHASTQTLPIVLFAYAPKCAAGPRAQALARRL